MIKKIINNTFLLPPFVKWSSQTIYQALLAALKIYQYTKSEKWQKRAENLKNILIQIQQKDGGFDIAYDFNFGLLHKKGESTSPECIGLLALVEYAKVFGADERLKKACDEHAQWIVTNAIKVSENKYYIPYSPYSTKEVMVYNGTSFACGALGAYIGFYEVKTQSYLDVYKGFINYLDSVMIMSSNFEGKFWPYYDLDRTDINENKKNKIDYYHQMQQVEMHSIANSYAFFSSQKNIIEEASKGIISVWKEKKYLPYTNNSKDFAGNIHVWGLASVIPGLLHFGKINLDYHEKIEEIIEFTYKKLLNVSWNNDFFYPIFDVNNCVVYERYMVRSDAWVINSLSNLLNEDFHFVDKNKLLNILDICFEKMQNCNFSGRESHASNIRTRFFSKLIALARFY